jgi:hypothetical protein
MRTLREKQQGILSLHRYLNLDTNVDEPLLQVSLFTQNCGLLKEKSNKKENSGSNSNFCT